MLFKHFIISRFNVNYKNIIGGRGTDPDKWLIERLEIFKKITFPSVNNQGCIDFIWLFYIDSETPFHVKEELADLFNPKKNYYIIEHEFSKFEIEDIIRKDLKNHLNGVENYIITTRLDTDDMISSDFVKRIQSEFLPKDYYPINLNTGLIFDLDSGVYASVSHLFNPFISLVEKVVSNQELKTVYYKMHHMYQNDEYVKKISTKMPMWVMTINNNNISTGFFGRPILKSNTSFVKDFGVTGLKKINLFKFLIFYVKYLNRKIIKGFNFIIFSIYE